jgi:hypothetical protein
MDKNTLFSLFSKQLSLILLFLISSSISANPLQEKLTEHSTKQATKIYQQLSDNQAQTLAKLPYWHKLLHINSVNADNSFIDDVRFYLSNESEFTAQNELQATIQALQSDPLTQCQFPARTLWLTQQINWLNSAIKTDECSEYNEWRSKLNTDSVVLVFAATQLNSPSSMYGHTFLRFDPKNVEQHSTYLSYALNFGANIPQGEDDFSYAIRGLAGGYPGNFAANPYFEKIREYNRAENRDLWEYQLNFKTDEINRMLAHIWELRGINFDYFFLDENCAYRLLELFDIARLGSNTITEFPGAVIPIDTVRIVQKHQFINEHYYRPSELTKLSSQIKSLKTDEQALVYQLANDINVKESGDFLKKSENTQNNITESAYRYLRFLNKGKARDKDISKRSFILLKELQKQRMVVDVVEPIRPDLGHDTTLWSITAGQAEFDSDLSAQPNEDQNFVEINFRASYHDLLDPINAYSPGMSLNMGKLTARYYQDDGLQLQHAQLLTITSLSPRDTFFQPWSWRADISIERLPVFDEKSQRSKEKLATQASGGGGVSYNLSDNVIVFAMATGRIEYNQHLKSAMSVAPGVNLGYLHYWPYGTSLIEFNEYYFIDDIKRSSLSFAFNLPLKKNQALRFSAKHLTFDDKSNSELNELSLEYRHYF